MKVVFTFSLAAAMLFAAGFAGSTAMADDPTAETLLGRIPRLSPKNKDLKSFECKLTIGTGPTSMPIQLAWQRPDRNGLLWMHPRNGSPVMYLSKKQAFVSDVISSTVYKFDSAHPSVILRIDGSKVNYRFGLVQKQVAELDFDLPSLFKIGTVDSVKRIDDRHCRLTRMSGTGKTKLVAVFHKDADWTVQDVRLIQIKDDTTLFTVSDIKINQPFPKIFHSFPQLTNLPKSLKVKPAISKSALKNLASGALMIRAMAAQVAFSNEELRKSVVFFGVDWKQAQRNERMVTPVLRQRLNLPIPKSETATKPDSTTRKTATRPPAVRR